MNFATSVLTATVHFVGIIAFMPQPATTSARTAVHDDGVRVASIRPSANAPISSPQSAVLAIIPQDFPEPIEKHTAMIMYRESDYVSSEGWKSESLHRDGLKYVTLEDGDLVSFDTGGATNPPVAFPNALPHNPAARLRTNQLALLPPYDPDNRSEATVVSIPAGTLSVCEDNHRSDTTITMNASGSFVIKVGSKGGTKTLRLKSGAEVAIVNVPLSFAEMPTDAHPSSNHYLEYCVMAGLPADRSHCPPPSYLPSAPACPWQGRDMLVAEANAGHTKSQAAGADCSNTQWP